MSNPKKYYDQWQRRREGWVYRTIRAILNPVLLYAWRRGWVNDDQLSRFSVRVCMFFVRVPREYEADYFNWLTWKMMHWCYANNPASDYPAELREMGRRFA